MEYQEFPKQLAHPAFKPARRIAEAIVGRSLAESQPEQWEPVKWPPVIVNTKDDEEYYLAKGYVPAGVANPAAFSTAHAAPFDPNRKHSEWPKMVNGVLTQDPNAPTSSFAEFPKWITPPKGDPVLVESKQQEDELLAQWTQPEEPKKKVASK